MASASPMNPAAEQLANGARLVVEALEREGVTTVFGYPGGAIMPLYDALPGSKLRHILVRHEQGAALAADAWGRMTGEPGVCIATSGPGATNLVTGIANAFMDSVPMIAITGQVATHLIGTDAFQEVDIFGITLRSSSTASWCATRRTFRGSLRRHSTLRARGGRGRC